MFKTFEYYRNCPSLIRAWKIAAFAALISFMMMLPAPSVQAAPPVSISASPQAPELLFQNPPVLELRKKTIPSVTNLTQPSVEKTRNQGEEVFDLNVVYTDSQIYNPATGSKDKVRLRSYVQPSQPPNVEAPFVAPTIKVKPGETVRINLNNTLPIDLTCKDINDVNLPHCFNFNRTNIHSHGLWISPTGNSDNVLSIVDPGVKFQYEYNIPPDHPAGTFWYHPHLHGSTALQVASGMVGALIVRGDRLPSATTNGDIDTLLAAANIPERILVLQQIQYACLDNRGNVKVKRDEKGQIVGWVCDPGDTGVIESYKGTTQIDDNQPQDYDLFGPGVWSQSGRYTSINGIIRPLFIAESGKVERWRIIHGGVRDTINLRFRKLLKDAPSPGTVTTKNAENYIREFCTGDPISYHIIADDGLTRSKAWKTNITTLQPGYRNDALVVFPEPGAYCVVDAPTTASGSVTRLAENRQLLGLVNVKEVTGTPLPQLPPLSPLPGTSPQLPPLPPSETQEPDIQGYVKTQLVAAAGKLNVQQPIKDRIINDLKNDLTLTAFTPHLDIDEKEVTGKQELAFFIDVSNAPKNVKFEVSNTIGGNFLPQVYEPKRVDRELTLGGVDEWTMTSYFAGHPFHIHVNPFQIVKIIAPNGQDVSLPDANDVNNNGKVDPEYRGLSGVWKDTLWIKGPTSNTPPTADRIIPATIAPATGVYKIVVRTRYQRYIGDFVLHCHILDHEDQGMMQKVSIVIANKVGGNSHH